MQSLFYVKQIVNVEPNKKQAYDEAVQNAESIIAGLNNPTINKGNVSSATQAVISSKNALDGVERLPHDIFITFIIQ
nr:FIVAR domain-containing protein [Staphylococcus aureus]